MMKDAKPREDSLAEGNMTGGSLTEGIFNFQNEPLDDIKNFLIKNVPAEICAVRFKA